jgi:nonsense-mediated mRNA decay protein 3
MSGKILCCLCGSSITPNEAAMCSECLKQQYDIQSRFDDFYEIVQCKKCERWNTSRNQWLHYEMESSALLSACLIKINGLEKMKILDAAWIWTEPHSKRMKITIDLEFDEEEVNLKLRQRVVIEFRVKNNQCLDCIHEATEHTWGAMIQLRQRVGNKRSLFTLEQGLIKSDMHHLIINFKVLKDGIDIYLKSKSDADKLSSYISSLLPSKSKLSKKLISQNIHNHTARIEYTIAIEVVPLCKGDLVVLPKTITGNADMMILSKLSSNLHFISPLTLDLVELTPSKYFTKPFQHLLTENNLIPFVVLDVNPLESKSSLSIISDTKPSIGMLAEAEVSRVSDFGCNDITYRVITHLGHILQPGDEALGYDLVHSILDEDLIASLPFECPDIVLIRKSFASKDKKKNLNNQNRLNHRGSKKASKMKPNENNSSVSIVSEFGDLSNNDESQNVEENSNENILTAGDSLLVHSTDLFGCHDEEDPNWLNYMIAVADEEGMNNELLLQSEFPMRENEENTKLVNDS